MKGCDVTTTSTRGTFLSVNHWQLTSSRHLRCAVRSSCIVLVSRETLLYERVNIDAKIGPALSCDHSVWNSWACLIGCDSLDTIAESESSLDLCLETNFVRVGSSTEITFKKLSFINDNQIQVDLIRIRSDQILTLCLSLTWSSIENGSFSGTKIWKTRNWCTIFRLDVTPTFLVLAPPVLWKSVASWEGFGGSWIRWPVKLNMFPFSSWSNSLTTSPEPWATEKDLWGFGPAFNWKANVRKFGYL